MNGKTWDIIFRGFVAVVGVVLTPAIYGIYARIGALEVGQAEIKVELRQSNDNSDDIDELTKAIHAVELEVERLKREQS